MNLSYDHYISDYRTNEKSKVRAAYHSATIDKHLHYSQLARGKFMIEAFCPNIAVQLYAKTLWSKYCDKISQCPEETFCMWDNTSKQQVLDNMWLKRYDEELHPNLDSQYLYKDRCNVLKRIGFSVSSCKDKAQNDVFPIQMNPECLMCGAFSVKSVQNDIPSIPYACINIAQKYIGSEEVCYWKNKNLFRADKYFSSATSDFTNTDKTLHIDESSELSVRVLKWEFFLTNLFSFNCFDTASMIAETHQNIVHRNSWKINLLACARLFASKCPDATVARSHISFHKMDVQCFQLIIKYLLLSDSGDLLRASTKEISYNYYFDIFDNMSNSLNLHNVFVPQTLLFYVDSELTVLKDCYDFFSTLMGYSAQSIFFERNQKLLNNEAFGVSITKLLMQQENLMTVLDGNGCTLAFIRFYFRTTILDLFHAVALKQRLAGVSNGFAYHYHIVPSQKSEAL